MADTANHQVLIDALTAELAPVRRLAPPWQRMLGWLAAVGMGAVALLAVFGAGPMLQRFAGAPDLGWAALGAVLTTLAAAWAAFTLSVPGRSRAWAWLPLPPALFWIAASGAGCLRTWLAPGTRIASLAEATDCLVFIVGFSIPLSVLMICLLRRACPLRPLRTALLVGLASAAGAASLMAICHAYDAAATDLVVHALAVGLVMVLNVAMGGRLLSPK